jgi:hypothetical protein
MLFEVLWMWFSNLYFSRILINVSHPLYICKQNLQAAMKKEDCGHNSRNLKLWGKLKIMGWDD